jgi:asparagine synthase (glutamine-hydrolysing)
MCGITGIFTATPTGEEETIVKSMNKTILHRGPDDEGYFFDKDIFLGMRRLSIIDISGGNQPIFNEDESIVVILNGEIYNYIELRNNLINKGHKFKTNTDTEVIVHLYEEKGIHALQDLNGMFAFCLWDKNKKHGYLVRDRLGIKHIYYTIHNNSLFFASELKALMKCPIQFDIDEDAIIAFLRYMYIPAPLTPFKNVQKMLPATYISFSLKGIDEPKEYWSIKSNSNYYNNSAETDLRSEFLQLIEDCVTLQLRSDVPVGLFLSGGVDSSMLTSFASKKLMGNIHTFSVKYKGTHVDETVFAELIAKKFNCQHKSIEVKIEDVNNNLPKIIWHMDEPFADSAIVGTYEICNLASKYIKVILNGTGGDELFGGYSWYLPEKIGKIATFTNILEKSGLTNLQNKCDFFSRSHILFNDQESDGFIKGTSQNDVNKYFRKNYANSDRDKINNMLISDTTFYAPNDLLLYLDKMTMAVSMEGRVPILDHRLVEWAFTISGNSKISNNEHKHLLKNWLKGILPDKILTRQKQGFGGPVEYWMNNGLLDKCFLLIDERPASREQFYWGLHANKLREKLFSLSSQKSFALLTLEIWFRIFVDKKEFNVSIEGLRS